MDPDDVRSAAVGRVARVFGRQVADIRTEAVFGDDLKASFRSDFRYNELDHIDFDIRDVAGQEILAEFASGANTITTVDDYCEHMVRCHATNPEDVLRVLAR